jgi:uncharacterized membrane protein
MEPRSTSYRILSALGYLPPVAIALLCSREFRPVKHLRFHALQSLVLMVLSILGAAGIGYLGSILGALPWIGFFLLSVTGLAISLWMVTMLGFAVYGALLAYQGKTTHLPVLDREIRRLDRALERRLFPDAEPKRRRKARPRP